MDGFARECHGRAAMGFDGKDASSIRTRSLPVTLHFAGCGRECACKEKSSPPSKAGKHKGKAWSQSTARTVERMHATTDTAHGAIAQAMTGRNSSELQTTLEKDD